MKQRSARRRARRSRSICAPAFERRRVLGRRVRVDLVHRHEQRAVEVALLQERQHVVLEDRLALLVAEERRAIAGPGIQLDLAVLARRGRGRRGSTSPSSKPRRPTPHWSISACASASAALSVDERPDDLGVDDDLGAGPVADRLDLRLDLRDRVGPEDAGLVVDVLAGDRVRERRSGRPDDRRNRAGHERGGAGTARRRGRRVGRRGRGTRTGRRRAPEQRRRQLAHGRRGRPCRDRRSPGIAGPSQRPPSSAASANAQPRRGRASRPTATWPPQPTAERRAGPRQIRPCSPLANERGGIRLPSLRASRRTRRRSHVDERRQALGLDDGFGGTLSAVLTVDWPSGRLSGS